MGNLSLFQHPRAPCMTAPIQGENKEPQVTCFEGRSTWHAVMSHIGQIKCLEARGGVKTRRLSSCHYFPHDSWHLCPTHFYAIVSFSLLLLVFQAFQENFIILKVVQGRIVSLEKREQAAGQPGSKQNSGDKVCLQRSVCFLLAFVSRFRISETVVQEGKGSSPRYLQSQTQTSTLSAFGLLGPVLRVLANSGI